MTKRRNSRPAPRLHQGQLPLDRLRVGATYRVVHSRLGTFQGTLVLYAPGEWAEFEVTVNQALSEGVPEGVQSLVKGEVIQVQCHAFYAQECPPLA